ncbi:MAG: hypothetical protein CMM45_05040 [Rhodospirillaceae bacterium]|nr:hypothetical protein [Rhodospirillaceae bacterium]
MVANSRRISLVKLELANVAGGKVPFTRCPITSLFVRFDLNKAIVSNDIVDPRAPEKPDRQFIASSVKGANVLQIDTQVFVPWRRKCPARPPGQRISLLLLTLKWSITPATNKNPFCCNQANSPASVAD